MQRRQSRAAIASERDQSLCLCLVQQVIRPQDRHTRTEGDHNRVCLSFVHCQHGPTPYYDLCVRLKGDPVDTSKSLDLFCNASQSLLAL
jgi:hypothetical protein